MFVSEWKWTSQELVAVCCCCSVIVKLKFTSREDLNSFRSGSSEMLLCPLKVTKGPKD